MSVENMALYLQHYNINENWIPQWTEAGVMNGHLVINPSEYYDSTCHTSNNPHYIEYVRNMADVQIIIYQWGSFPSSKCEYSSQQQTMYHIAEWSLYGIEFGWEGLHEVTKLNLQGQNVISLHKKYESLQKLTRQDHPLYGEMLSMIYNHSYHLFQVHINWLYLHLFKL